MISNGGAETEVQDFTSGIGVIGIDAALATNFDRLQIGATAQGAEIGVAGAVVLFTGVDAGGLGEADLVSCDPTARGGVRQSRAPRKCRTPGGVQPDAGHWKSGRSAS